MKPTTPFSVCKEFCAGSGGASGTTFIPNVSPEGVISWTNDGGLENPDPVTIKGKDGYTPQKGKDYFTDAEMEKIKIDVKEDLPKVATSGSYEDLSDKPTIVGDLSGSVDDNAIPTGRAVQRCVGDSANEVVTFLEAQLKAKANTSDLSAVATSGSYNDLLNGPFTVLELYPFDNIDDMLYGCYVYNAQYNYEPSIMVIAGCYYEDINETPDGEWAKTYTYRQHIIDSRRGFVVREKAICDSYADWNYDWREVPLNDNLSTKDYVNTAIGDVETSLENIIAKYGLGGDSL